MRGGEGEGVVRTSKWGVVKRDVEFKRLHVKQLQPFLLLPTELAPTVRLSSRKLTLVS